MALFGTKKTASAKAETKKALKATESTRSFDHVLIAPRITEKSTFSAENNVYVFDIAMDASKIDVKAAMQVAYKVTPIKVSITKVPSQKVFYRGKRGVKSAGKKAYVYLDKKDKIELL